MLRFSISQELTHDKIALQKKVHDQMNHISQLKSQVEDLKLGGEHRYQTGQVQELQKLLEQEREAGEMREKEVCIVMHVHSPLICRTPHCCISV